MKPQPFFAHFAFACGLLFLARPVSAQSTGPYATTFTANFDVAYHESFFDNSNVGAHFDLAGTVKRDVPMVAIVGEAGFNHFSDATVVMVSGGARVRIPIEDDRFEPFGELMVGLYHCSVCNENDPALEAGGGVDFRVPRRRSFKLRAQLDYRHVFSGGGGFDAVRLSGGIVLPLSGR